MQAFVTIHRAAPDSIDPAFSTVGHEPVMHSPMLKSYVQIENYLNDNAPEVVGVKSETWIIDPGRTVASVVGRDARGYYTEVHIHCHYGR